MASSCARRCPRLLHRTKVHELSRSYPEAKRRTKLAPRMENEDQGARGVISRAFWAGLLCIPGLLCIQVAAAEDWIPASSEELHMTSVPEAPGAPAIFLYRQVDRDDSRYSESIYVRIK